MINKAKSLLRGWAYSLRARMILVIIAGALMGTILFVASRFLMVTVVDSYLTGDEARTKRELQYVQELQTYIDKNELSSSDISEISDWIKQHRYTYIMVYKDEELLFSGGINDPDADIPQMPGASLDYPSLEEIKDYAEKNDQHVLHVSDGTIFASVSDFSEYLYYDVINLISLVIAFLMLAIVLMSYFIGLTKRITELSHDVTAVSESDMNHKIRADGNDEFASLSRNIEQMRSAMVENIAKEREARDANAELITSMSHDIRTPLTVLLGYIDLMKSRESDSVMKDYIKATESTALRLKELSDDMFRYFLVFGNRKVDVEVAEYDARTVIEQLFSEHILLLCEKGYSIVEGEGSDMEEGLIVRTDAPKAMRIIDNVFSNIYKYAAPDTPIEFTVKTNGDKLEVRMENRVKENNDRAESNGIGLKTCMKMAEAIGLGFDYGLKGNKFITEIRFPIVEGSV